MILKKICISVRILILFIVMVVMLAGYRLATMTVIKHTVKRGIRLRRAYLIIANFVLGFKIMVEGKPPVTPALYVSNHRGILDFFATLRYLDAYVLSKAEVRDIFLLGKASELTGIFFVQRESKDSRKATRKAIIQILKSGYNVLIYPEGTTNTKRTTAPFKPGAFEEVAKHGFPVVPIAQEYKDKSDLWDDESIVEQMTRQFGKCFTYTKLAFGPVIQSDDPQYLLEESKKWIDNKLLEMQKNWSKAYD